MAGIKIKKKKSGGKVLERKIKIPLFPVFVALVAVCCVFVGIRCYQTAYDKMLGKLAEDVDETAETQYSPNEIIQQAKENLIGADLDGVIKDIDYINNSITMLNLTANESIVLTATEDTVYPGTLGFEDYMIGDVITYVYDSENNLTDVKKCNDAWIVSDVGLEVSKSSKRLTFGSNAANLEGKSYSYSDICTVRYKNEYCQLEDIDSVDYVTIQGYDTGTSNKAYAITIEKSHGEIQFLNYDNIDEPKLNLNGKVVDLENNSTMKITEGTHTIEVTSPSCEDFSKEVIILPGETTIVDLSEMQIKSGILKVSPNVGGYKIFVDDVEYSSSEPILLSYGKYKLTVTKDDYDDFTTTVTINQDVNTVDVTMKKRTKLGTIKVTASPDGTRIYIDGSYVGTAPVDYKVEVGSHTVSAKLENYIEDIKEIIIGSEGDIVNCTFDLTPVVSRYVETN